jgi:hypothetical protein
LASILGSTIFISAAENVLSNHLLTNLRHIHGIDAVEVWNTGATQVMHAVPPELLGQVLLALNEALMNAVEVYEEASVWPEMVAPTLSPLSPF